MLPGITVPELDHASLVALATLGPVEGRCVRWIAKYGRHCLRRPIKGGTVCVMHGGRAPQIAAAAARRLAVGKAESIAHRLGVPVEVDPHEALLGALYSAWGDVVFWRHVVSELKLKDGDSSGIIGVNHLGDQALHVAVGALSAAQERTAKFAKACLDAGFTERQVRVAEGQSVLMERVLVGVLRGLGVDAAATDVRRLLADQLRQLDAGTIDVESEEL